VRDVLAAHLKERDAPIDRRPPPPAPRRPPDRRAEWAPPSGLRLAGPFQIWRPVGQTAPPTSADGFEGGPPLAWNHQGKPIRVPHNAAGWLVQRRLAAGARAPVEPVFIQDGAPLIIDLRAPHAWLRSMLAGRGRLALRLELLDAAGRLLRVASAFTLIGATTEAEAFPSATAPRDAFAEALLAATQALAARRRG